MAGRREQNGLRAALEGGGVTPAGQFVVRPQERHRQYTERPTPGAEMSQKLDTAQSLASIAAFIDPSGVVSAGNAITYALRAMEEPERRGELLGDAAVSAVGAIPIIGKAAIAGRAARAAKAASGIRGGSRAGQVAKFFAGSRERAMTSAEMSMMLARPALFPDEDERPSERVADATRIAQEGAERPPRTESQHIEGLAGAAMNLAFLAGSGRTGGLGGRVARSKHVQRLREAYERNRGYVWTGLGAAATGAGGVIEYRQRREARRRVDEIERRRWEQKRKQEQQVQEFASQSHQIQHRMRNPFPVPPDARPDPGMPDLSQVDFSVRGESPDRVRRGGGLGPAADRADKAQRESGLLGRMKQVAMAPLKLQQAVLQFWVGAVRRFSKGLLTAGAAAFAFNEGLTIASRLTLAHAKQYQPYSAQMSAEAARSSAREVARMRYHAQTVGGTYARLQDARDDIDDRMQKYKTAISGVFTTMLTLMEEAKAFTFAAWEWTTPAIPMATKFFNWIMGLDSSSGQPYTKFMRSLVDDLAKDANKPTARRPRGGPRRPRP